MYHLKYHHHTTTQLLSGLPVRVVGGMQFLPREEGWNGHFVAWLKFEQWVIVNDHFPQVMKRKLPNRMSGMNVLIFQFL